jgi:hypothetical protein
VWPADFRRSEGTLLDSLPKGLRDALTPEDVVCFVSSDRKQVLFVIPRITLGVNGRGKDVTLLTSMRMRIAGSTFSPANVRQYAEKAGLELLGIEHFERTYAQLMAARTSTIDV